MKCVNMIAILKKNFNILWHDYGVALILEIIKKND